jgi:hypothetical protein
MQRWIEQNTQGREARAMNDWLGRSDLLAFLPRRVVDQILQDTNHFDFEGNPIVPVDELNDWIALAQLDFDIRDDS